MASDDYMVTVCAACKRASCWHGEIMCEDARRAGTVKLPASSLRDLRKEHATYYSRENLVKVTGFDPEPAS